MPPAATNEMMAQGILIDDELAKESEELDGYFSDTPLEPKVIYPNKDNKFTTTIVITNLPIVSESKYDKLKTVIYKLVKKIGTLQETINPITNEISFNGLYMPLIVDDNDTNNAAEVVATDSGPATTSTVSKRTTGFCFVEYTTVEYAKQAVEVLQKYKFDKNHELIVTTYDSAKKLQSIPANTGTGTSTSTSTDTTTSNDTSKTPPYEEKPIAISWLEDTNQRDQFIIRYNGKETCCYWWDPSTASSNASGTAAPGATTPAANSNSTAATGQLNNQNGNLEIYYDGQREKDSGIPWCDYYCFWSTNGSYLATLLPNKGVIIWSGSTFEKIGKYPAPGVKIVIFSPQENYILTNNQDPYDKEAIKIYHIISGKLLRSFPLYPAKITPDPTGIVPPPPFLWSYDDQYIARMGENLITIYETPKMTLLDQRSLTTESIAEFQWSPKANIIAYWAPELNNTPAHVDLIEIPSRTKLRQKNLFNVNRCSMVWHDYGYYLAVKVTRHTKSKKTLYNNIELFRLNEIGIPVEMLDVKDAVMAFQFESKNGTKFAMIHAENPSAAKVKVSFYDMMKLEEQLNITSGPAVGLPVGMSVPSSGNNKKKTITKKIPELNLIETLEGKQCNYISWSPAGNTIIMASLGDSASGTIEFYDVTTKTMVVKEHYRSNQIVWDPSGRTVVSIVSQPVEGGNFKFAMDNGYTIWSFQGKQLVTQSYESFYQFLWRPRPDSLLLLSKNDIDKIKRNLKTYEKRFDKADKVRRRTLYLEETAGKRNERSKFRSLIQQHQLLRTKYRTEYIQLLDGYDSNDDNNYIITERTYETILSKTEESVS